jgi:hypothetical protein
MIKYGDTHVQSIRFAGFAADIERKPQWVEVRLSLQLPPGTQLPDDLTEPSALVIAAYDGKIIEYAVLDEGCDSEYQFTDEEKAQIAEYVRGLNIGRFEHNGERRG